jgi:D,D-heptose 1,7-bisphosphate phosphatase
MEMFEENLQILKYRFVDFTGKFAVILDRDGTLNHDLGYTHKVQDLEILPGVKKSLQALANLGAQFFIASNQSGLGRGYYTIKDMEIFNLTLLELIQEQGIVFCGLYVCPHEPFQNSRVGFSCSCRKPESGLIENLIEDFRLESEKTIMVGNSESDVAAAKAASVKGLLVSSAADWLKVVKYAEDSLC